MNLIQHIAAAMESDDWETQEEQSPRLLTFYQQATESQQEAIDTVMTYVCGYRLCTLIQQMEQGSEA